MLMQHLDVPQAAPQRQAPAILETSEAADEAVPPGVPPVPPSPGQRALRTTEAEKVLRGLAPACSAAVRERLRRENVVSARDLAGLDKEDLRELGLSMVERSKVLQWASRLQLHTLRQQGSINESDLRRGTKDSLPLFLHRDSLERAGTPPEASGAATPLNDHGNHSGAHHLGYFKGSSGNIFALEEEQRTYIAGCLDMDPADEEDSLFYDEDESMWRHLDEVERDSEFWCQLVREDSGFRQLRSQLERVEKNLRDGGDKARLSDMREDLLEKFFDLSPERLKELYDCVREESEGRFFKEQLREALRLAGFELHGLDGALEKVLSAVSTSNNGSIQLPEFESMLTRLKLAQLLCGSRFHSRSPHANAGLEHLSILDYNMREAKGLNIHAREFFFGHRCQEYPMRWVHMGSPGLDLTLLLALMVKYQLHPLSVEDVIDQSPTRIDKYGAHCFAAVEHLCLACSSAPTEEPVQVVGRHVSLFCAGPPHLDTVITITQVDRTFEEDWPGEQPFPRDPRCEDPWVKTLRKRLHMTRSRVRERKADFLMYEIFDLCADDLVRVARAFHMRLQSLEGWLQRLQKRKEHFCLDDSNGEREHWFEEVQQIRIQLGLVARRLRGLQRVLRRLGDDVDLSRTLSGYWQDVADHINEAYDDALADIEKCKGLVESFHHMEDKEQEKEAREVAQRQTEQDERMNRILFVLTIVTTVFTPITFLAGVYGMNFGNEEGVPTIPELLWPQGYLLFWIVILIYFCLSIMGTCWLWKRCVNVPRKSSSRDSREVLEQVSSYDLCGTDS